MMQGAGELQLHDQHHQSVREPNNCPPSQRSWNVFVFSVLAMPAGSISKARKLTLPDVHPMAPASCFETWQARLDQASYKSTVQQCTLIPSNSEHRTSNCQLLTCCILAEAHRHIASGEQALCQHSLNLPSCVRIRAAVARTTRRSKTQLAL